ncbi:MAG: DUF1080 domain-containing protein [Puniceicoccales bacterium]|jgi:hypothetical protein|nr:DUF1080 domain-containing protein [Puniceicoccales bacterium]
MTRTRFLLATAALAALIALPSHRAFAADNDSNKIKKVAGECKTTPPPSDAEVLFDGTEKSKENWVPERSNNAKVWPIKNGVWVADATDIKTKKEYGSCRLHLEWRVPKGRVIDGQKGGNSGIIFMYRKGWYEVQILESHSNKGTYADGMAGSLYNHHAPLVNPSLPQGEWQSYDITFTAPKFGGDKKVLSNPRFTLVYNGVTVQDDRELTGTTLNRGSKLNYHPARLPIALQWHKDPLEFRNIWIQDLEKDTAQK